MRTTVGGLTLDRNLPRPSQCRAPVFPRVAEWAAVFVHLGITEFALNRTGEHTLDKHVAFDDHLLVGFGTQPLKESPPRFGPLVPPPFRDDGFHVADASHELRIPARPVEAQRRTPVMHHQHQRRISAREAQKLVQVVAMLDKSVAIRAGRDKLFGIAHADQVRRNAGRDVEYVGNDVTPQVGRGRITVQKDNRTTAAAAVIGHALTEHLQALLRECCSCHVETLTGTETLPLFHEHQSMRAEGLGRQFGRLSSY